MVTDLSENAEIVNNWPAWMLRLTRGPAWMTWVLILGLLNGLLYVFIVPPWQHYDEPNHFEYVWLVAQRGSIPQPGDFDPGMRRAVAESMIEHGFFGPLGFLPDLEAPDGDIWIGQYPQVGDPPLYYVWAALPVKLLQGAGDITQQLYAARLASLVLFLLTLIAACGVIGELTPPRHVLRLLFPLSLALLPAFVDLMTAVNNDAAAVAVFSWFLWGATRLVQRGLNWVDLIWSLAFAILGLFTRQTAYFAILILPLAVVLAWHSRVRPIWRTIAWVVGGLMILSALLALFSWGDAAWWYRHTLQPAPDRAKTTQAPVGEYALYLQNTPQEDPGRLVQALPIEQARQLAGKQFTLGAWMWANRPVEVRSPELYVYARGKGYSSLITLTTEPQFFAFTTLLGRDTVRSWVILEPSEAPQTQPLEVYYDGLVLVEGAFPVDIAPEFSSPAAESGTWAGIPFTNLIRNASAEDAWPRVNPRVDGLVGRLLPGTGFERLSLTLYSVFDTRGVGWYFERTFKNLVRTFWAVFGWNEVILPGNKPYRPLAWITIIGLLGALWAGWRYRRQIPWRVVILYAAALAGVWGFAMLRGSNYVFLRTGFLPPARYVFPVVIPAMLAFVAGWFVMFDLSMGGWLRHAGYTSRAWLVYLPFGLFFFGLNIYCLVSMVQFWQAAGVL
jgi:hypothetical protein